MNRNFLLDILRIRKTGSTKLFFVVVMLLSFLPFSGAFAQGTIIGTFPQMDGGFETATVPTTQASTTVAAGVQLTSYTGANLTNSTPALYTGTTPTAPRTGATALQWVSSSTSGVLFTPTATSTAVANATSYVLQFYWFKAQNGSARALGCSISPDGTLSLGTSVPSAVLGTNSVLSTAWTKETVIVTSGSSSNATRYGLLQFKPSGGSFATSPGYLIDDLDIYPGTAADVTAPDPATAAVAAPASSTSMTVSFSAPATGVDGGGYIVVRQDGTDPTTLPNTNGIYALNSAIGGGTVAYIGTATTFTDNGLTNGHTYYYRIYTCDKAFNYATAATCNATLGTSTTPTIVVTPGAFTGSFGNTVMSTSSTSQQYSVNATNLTANLIVTAPADFEVSTAAASGYGSSVSLTPVSGTVAPTTIYARYSPIAATGASGSLNITNASTGAATQNVAVNGNALAVEPTTAGAITFGTATTTSLVLNLPTIGNGSKRIIVGRQGSAPTFTPTDAVAVTGVNANFTAATDQGSGSKIVYDGTGSGASVVTVTGLTASTAYYFIVYEYNVGTGTSQNYLLTPVASGNSSTAAPAAPVITINQTGFTGLFGNVVMGTSSANQTYTVTGANLTANITITAPAGFEISTAAASGFGTTLTLTQTAGNVAATTIYARFSPSAATGATGTLNITQASTGATTQNVAVSGNALAVEPTTAGTITFGTTATTTMVINLPAIGNGSKRIIVAKQGSTPTYTPTDGIVSTGVNANFTTATDQGSGNKIVYDGSGSGASVVTVTGLNGGSVYYFTVYEYNEGTGTSQNYLLTPAATGNNTTAGVLAPSVVINQTGFTGAFGNIVTGTNATNQTYTVTGANLTADITITAPAGFQISTAAASGFGTTLNLTQTAGAVATTTIYTRYSPTAATGATGNLNITHSSTGATTQTVTVSGNALAVEPTTAGAISFGTTTATSMVVNLPTIGNGSKRIIVARQGSAPTFSPTDGVVSTGVNANFTTATDQGAGSKIVYDGTGSGASVVTVTGLTQGTAYYFKVYEYNEGTGTSQNYLLAPTATGNNSTPTPTIVVNQTGFAGAFGNIVTGTNAANQTYTVTGTGLTADITITAPAGFQVSTAAASGFGTTLTLTQTAGAVATTTIYARYSPTAATGATGSLNITHTSTGATTQNVTVSGNALAVEPTTSGTITFGTIAGTSIVVNLPTIGNGTKRIIVIHAASAVSFVPTDGVALTGVSAAFGTATDQGSGNKVIYDGTGSGNGVVTVTGLTSGTAYYFTVYEYNVGTGTSQNYLISPAATGNATTIIPVPAITVTPGTFTGNFGNVVTATNSATQQYTVSGVNLSSNIIITPPAGFQVSLSASSGFTTAALSIAPSSGTVPTTTVYVRYSPTAATGATGTLNITNASTGVTTQTLAVTGNALAAEPTLSGTIGFSTITPTSMVVNLPTIGNGGKRIIVIKQGAATTFVPTDGVAVTGVNSDYSLATNQGAGDRIIYNGSGSGTGVVTLTGLTQGTQYYFTVFEYNEGTGTSQNYRTSPVATGMLRPSFLHRLSLSIQRASQAILVK